MKGHNGGVVDDEDVLLVLGLNPGEGKLGAVAAPRRLVLLETAAGQPAHVGAVGVHDVDPEGLSAPLGREGVFLPSGEKTGSVSRPGLVVRRRTLAPFTSMT